MPNEIIINLQPGEERVFRVKAPRTPFDYQPSQEGLEAYRRFAEAHWEQIEYLLGGQPEDQDSLLMDAQRELPEIIDAVRRSRIPQPELVSLTAGIFRSSGRWSGPPEKAGDMGQALVNLLAQVAQGIPKK